MGKSNQDSTHTERAHAEHVIFPMLEIEFMSRLASPEAASEATTGPQNTKGSGQDDRYNPEQ